MASRSTTHPGVSVRALSGGRYRLRWRERCADGAGVGQSWTAHLRDAAEAERWAIEVYRSLQASGTFQRPAEVGAAPVVPVRPREVDVRDLWVAWASWRITHKRIQRSTARRDRECLAASERALRAVHRLPAGGPIPLELLDTWTCEQMVGWLQRRGNGSSRQSAVMGAVYQAWVWASDDEDGRWPGLRSAPRTRSKVVPARSEPPTAPAPTLAEMDALVREARRCRAPSCAGDVLEVMRGTGLRISQVMALRVDDLLDLHADRPRLKVRGGKSRQERAGRVVPVAPCLLPLLRRRCWGRAPGDRVMPTRPGPDTLKGIVQRCVARGEVRQEVVQPDGRGNLRTSHSMRAGLQRLLRRRRVEDRVIDLLVGHKGATVRDRHYDIADWSEQVAAVALIPQVDEGAPDARPINPGARLRVRPAARPGAPRPVRPSERRLAGTGAPAEPLREAPQPDSRGATS